MACRFTLVPRLDSGLEPIQKFGELRVLTASSFNAPRLGLQPPRRKKGPANSFVQRSIPKAVAGPVGHKANIGLAKKEEKWGSIAEAATGKRWLQKHGSCKQVYEASVAEAAAK